LVKPIELRGHRAFDAISSRAPGYTIWPLRGRDSTCILVSVFDGIFVFHYFVEAFIWKFSDQGVGRSGATRGTL